MSRMILKKITMSILALCLFLLMNGCYNYDAEASRMVPGNFEVTNKHHSTIILNESVGGKEARSPLLYTSDISNSAFTEALNNALAKSGVFQGVIKDGDADYILDVTILDYDQQPWGGFHFDISISVKWELTDTETLVPVWSDTFETSSGHKRRQKAMEGSARENIREGIRRLSLLNL